MVFPNSRDRDPDRPEDHAPGAVVTDPDPDRPDDPTETDPTLHDRTLHDRTPDDRTLDDRTEATDDVYRIDDEPDTDVPDTDDDHDAEARTADDEADRADADADRAEADRGEAGTGADRAGSEADEALAEADAEQAGADRADADETDADRADAYRADAYRAESDRAEDDRAEVDAAGTGIDTEAGPGTGTEAAMVAATAPGATDETPADERAAGLMPGEVPAPAAMWESDATDAFRDRWRDLQLRFVDDPVAAAGEAQALVGEVVEAVTARLVEQRTDLDGWRTGNDGDTEHLRMVIRRYRDLLDRLLSL